MLSCLMLAYLVIADPNPTTEDGTGVTLEQGECGGCADYNQDGSVDGSDLWAFMDAYDAGIVDMNCDMRCDAADLIAFFTAWVDGANCSRFTFIQCIGC